MSNIFIHPELLLTVKQELLSQNETLDSLEYEEAKKDGEEKANQILKDLFKSKTEYGDIESHFNTEKLNSNKFIDFREKIISIHFQKKLISRQVSIAYQNEKNVSDKLNKTQNSFFSFLFKKKIQTLLSELNVAKQKSDSIMEVEKESYIDITFKYELLALKEKYSDLLSAFTTLKNSNKIWDVTTTQRNFETKAAAETSITRNEVKFSFQSLEIIRTQEKNFHFENFNGGDFYFYPNFILYFKNNEEIAILDYSDLFIVYKDSRFLEENKNIPVDAKIVGETWYRVNKDGSADKRFMNNFKIPIVLYGDIHLKTKSGINELFSVSDNVRAKHFVEQYVLYQSLQRKNYSS